VSRLPLGYDTALADAPMSGGEAQRLGLARAWHAQRLLVLDDATSSLDMVTEMQISRTLTGDHGGRTRLIVTHRVSTAARADLVVWLENGRVRAVGPHQRLWNDPDFRKVFG
jgi:ATP-binding cassette subfamily B protein